MPTAGQCLLHGPTGRAIVVPLPLPPPPLVSPSPVPPPLLPPPLPPRSAQGDPGRETWLCGGEAEGRRGF